MITLNTDQGLVNIENWEDVEARPGFVADLDFSKHTLAAVIGRYVIKDKKCGLSNCHQTHTKGYIVTTKEGLSTNIGKDCGKKYLGVDFDDLAKKLDRDITASENRSRLCSFSFKIEEIELAIAELRHRPRGADWVHKKTSALLSPANSFPTEVIRRLTAMVKTSTDVLTAEREATEAEAQNIEAMRGKKLPRPYIISEPIAEIAGLQALYPENDLRKLLVLDLIENLNSFKSKNIDTMTHEELRHWNKWADTVEKTMEQAKKTVQFGNDLLTTTNLKPFLSVLKAKDEISGFRAFLKDLETAPA